MDRIIWRVDTSQAERYFEIAGYRARNMRDPLQESRAILLHHIAMTFETEGDWAGVEWPELNADYEAWKEKHRPGRPKLVFDRELVNAAISRRTTHIEGNDTLRYELEVPAYADAHQDGATWVQFNHKGQPVVHKLPARPFVVETEALTAQIEAAFIAWLARTRSANRSRSRDPFSSVSELFS